MLEHSSVNVILQFESEDGVPVGSQFDISSDVSPEQLEQLLNQFLGNEHRLPYAFYLNDRPLDKTLKDHLLENRVSVENSVRVIYQPQAVFRVRAVTRCTASLQGHSEAILNCSFSPDGKRLVTGSGDATVRHWDLNSNTPLQTCKDHRNWVLVVSWSPDGDLLTTGDMDGHILVWDPLSTNPQGSCRGHKKWITSMAWKPVHLTSPCVHFCSGSKDCTIRIWNAKTRRCEMTLSNQQKLITCVKWGGNDCIYSSSRDTTIAVWNAMDGTLIKRLSGHAHWVNTMALSTDHILRTGPFDRHGNAPIDHHQRQKIALEKFHELTKGKTERLVSGSDDHTMILWNPSDNNPLIAKLTGHLQLINQVQFSPDGRWIISASFDKSIKVWDGIRGTFYASLFGHVAPVFQIAWSPDSRFFVSGSKDSTLKVWDIKAKKVAEDLPGHADEVYAVDWSPDGASVASGGKDRMVKIWKH